MTRFTSLQCLSCPFCCRIDLLFFSSASGAMLSFDDWLASLLEFHDVKHALLEFSCTVRTRAGDLVKAGTQVLDRQWRSLKDYLPKTLATKSKAGHVNQSLWQWTYSWQYRYNNGKDLWAAVPHVLKHIRNAWVQNSPRLYGRRYLYLFMFVSSFHLACALQSDCIFCSGLRPKPVKMRQ